MAWGRLDDQYFEHRKVIDCSKDAKLLHLKAILYCAAQLTDGHLSRSALRVCMASVDVESGAVDELVAAGLFDALDDGAYYVHDYLEWNPSADHVLEQKRARKEAGSKGGRASAQAFAQAPAQAFAQAPAEANAQAKPKHLPKQKLKQNSSNIPSPSPSLSDTVNPPNPPKGGSARNGFSPPTEGEVREYAKSIGFDSLDAEHFIAYYTANGWKQGGKAPVKDWKACVVTWKKRAEKDAPKCTCETRTRKTEDGVAGTVRVTNPRCRLHGRDP